MPSHSGFMQFAREKWAAKASLEEINQAGQTERTTITDDGNTIRANAKNANDIALQKLGDKGRFSVQELKNTGFLDVKKEGNLGRENVAKINAASNEKRTTDQIAGQTNIAELDILSREKISGNQIGSREGIVGKQIKSDQTIVDKKINAQFDDGLGLSPDASGPRARPMSDIYKPGNDGASAGFDQPNVFKPAKYVGNIGKAKRTQFLSNWQRRTG